MKQVATKKIGVNMIDDAVFVLSVVEEMGSCEREILGVFREYDDAVKYKNIYIREALAIDDDDVPDEELEDEASYCYEFTIGRYVIE
jgi:hypothetical protein